MISRHLHVRIPNSARTSQKRGIICGPALCFICFAFQIRPGEARNVADTATPPSRPVPSHPIPARPHADRFRTRWSDRCGVGVPPPRPSLPPENPLPTPHPCAGGLYNCYRPPHTSSFIWADRSIDLRRYRRALARSGRRPVPLRPGTAL